MASIRKVKDVIVSDADMLNQILFDMTQGPGINIIRVHPPIFLPDGKRFYSVEYQVSITEANMEELPNASKSIEEVTTEST
jgi:hypothetical protein